MRAILDQLEKLYRDNTCDYNTYYVGGTLCVDMPNDNEPLYMLNVRDINQFTEKQERDLQYLVSALYIHHKTPKAALYEQAMENVHQYQDGGYFYEFNKDSV